MSERDVQLADKPSWLDQRIMGWNWEQVLYALLILVALLTRLWSLDARTMSHDESLHTMYSWELFKGHGFAHTPLMHGPLLFIANAFFYHLFGDGDFSARLYPALLGALLVAFPYLLRRWLGRGGALAAACLFLISPSLLYYSRYIRHDIPAIAFALIMVWAMFRYLQGEAAPPAFADDVVGLVRYNKWLVLLAAAMSLMLASKEVAFIYIAIVGLFLLIVFFYRLESPRWRTPDWQRVHVYLLWACLFFLLVALLALGVAVVVGEPETNQEPEMLADPLSSESPPQVTESNAADLWKTAAVLALATAVLVVFGYMGVLAWGTTSHDKLFQAILAVLGSLAVSLGLILLILNLFGLYPVKLMDCANPAPALAQTCTDDGCKIYDGRCQRPAPVVVPARGADSILEFDQEGQRIAVGTTRLQIAITWLLMGGLAIATGVAVYWILTRLMPAPECNVPGAAVSRQALDLIVVVGSLILPWLSPLLVFQLPKLLSGVPINPLDYGAGGLVRTGGFILVFLAMSVAIGLWWNWRRWLLAALVFYVIYVVLFTTIFTNGSGLATGMVGSLGYWLEQQGVARGSQPLYYYFLMVPLYEYLPLFGAVLALLIVVRRWLMPNWQREQFSLFIPFVLLWLLLTVLIYSYAGEKMPWLVVHFAVPMILLAGWAVEQMMQGVDWRVWLRRGGWLILLMMPVIMAALAQTVGPWLSAGGRPLAGHTRSQLNATGQWLAALIILAALLALLYRLGRRLDQRAMFKSLVGAVFVVLALLTVRTSWAMSFINYDYPTEFLVYAHGGDDVKTVMAQIAHISRQVASDKQLDIGYSEDGSWPFKWYLRNYPNAIKYPRTSPNATQLQKSVLIVGNHDWGSVKPYLGDNYVCKEHTYLWWPMQDYWGLNWERIRYALFNPAMRQGVWDIIFKRDYTQYEAASGHVVKLSSWPMRNDFRLCVRRDVLESVWDGDVGPLAASWFVAEEQIDPFAELGTIVKAEQVLTVGGAPHAMAFDAEGFMYVADGDNHRIVKLSPAGEIVDTWDSTWHQALQPGSWQLGCVDPSTGAHLSGAEGELCDPWGVAVAPNGNVYVADTWNHRIQVYSPDGQLVTTWGKHGQVQEANQSGTEDWFYGPRSIVIDERGRIYVSDTGNKRIQVYDHQHQYLTSLGGGGVLPGYLDEPVGLAIGPDANLYVADTWNWRVQAFATDGVFDFEREWPVPGWQGQSIVNKPYLAVGPDQRVYVSDPEGYRVLIFDQSGNPLAALGQYGNDESSFMLPTGLVIDAQGKLWVSDAGTGRLLRFSLPKP